MGGAPSHDCTSREGLQIPFEFGKFALIQFDWLTLPVVINRTLRNFSAARHDEGLTLFFSFLLVPAYSVCRAPRSPVQNCMPHSEAK